MTNPTRTPGRSTPARKALFRGATAVAALCTATALLISAMSDASAAPAAVPAKPAATGTPAPGTYDTYAGLAYVTNGTSKQTLNLYVPRGVKGPIPVIM